MSAIAAAAPRPCPRIVRFIDALARLIRLRRYSYGSERRRLFVRGNSVAFGRYVSVRIVGVVAPALLLAARTSEAVRVVCVVLVGKLVV